MWKNRLLGSTVATALLTMAGVALGQSQSQPQTQLTQHPASAAALNNFEGNQASLNAAIAMVERNTHGKVAEIHYRPGASGTYNAVVVHNGKIQHVRTDIGDRVMVMTARETPEWMLSWKQRADMKSLDQASVPLSDAVMTAQKAAGGPAIDAGLAKPLTATNNVLAYNVEVIQNGKPVRVAVDANSNQVIANPEMFEQWNPEQKAGMMRQSGSSSR